jgi:hypothetical protein
MRETTLHIHIKDIKLCNCTTYRQFNFYVFRQKRENKRLRTTRQQAFLEFNNYFFTYFYFYSCSQIFKFRNISGFFYLSSYNCFAPISDDNVWKYTNLVFSTFTSRRTFLLESRTKFPKLKNILVWTCLLLTQVGRIGNKWEAWERITKR